MPANPIVCNPNVSSSESITARYTVEITPSGAARHEVSVKAVISLGGATDLTVTSPDQGFKARWVTIERCYDSANRTIPIEEVDNRTWKVSPYSPGEVTIEYTARADIPSSMAVGYYLTYLSESCGLLYAGAIILRPPNQGKVIVNFVMPSGWSVITDETWSPINSTAFTVWAGDLELFAPGNWSIYNGTFGDGQRLRVAICGATKYDKGVYLNGIKTCLDYFHEHIGKLPQEELNVVLAELPLPMDYMSGTPRLAVNRADRDWGMFEGMLWHYWFLRSVRYNTQYDEDRAWWFGEGASPFLLHPVYEAMGVASDVAIAYGSKYDNLTWKNWYEVYKQYVGTKYNIPLVEYPAKYRETSDVRYYVPLPYMKGHLVLEMLNLSMVEVTHGAKDLRDLVKYLYENYVIKGIGYRVEDILTAVNTISGNDYTAFFDAYVYGNETLPVLEQGGDYLFDWSILGNKTYMSLPNTDKVRPTPQSRCGPEWDSAALLEMRKESSHFTVYFHKQDEKMAALLLLDSERAYDAVTKIYGSEGKLKIKMFMTYNSTEYAILGGNPKAVYGEDVSSGGVGVESGDEINWLRPIPRTQTQMYDMAVPIHELGHALMRQTYPHIYDNWEQWFNEGMPLAEMAWLDSKWAPDDYSPFKDHEAIKQLQSSLTGGSPSVIPLTQLAKMNFIPLNSTEQLLVQAEGITFHFYIVSRYDNGLRRLLIEYNRSVPLSVAVERAFGITYSDLEEELWATAKKAALHVNSSDAVISRIRREGVDTSLAERLRTEEPFLALVVAYSLETRAGAGPEHLNLGTLTPGTPTKVSLRTTPLTSLTIEPTERAENVSLSVGEVENDGIAPPSGEVYCYVGVNCSSTAIGTVTVAFKIESSWISERNIDSSTVNLLRLTDGAWVKLPTGKTGEDGSYHYFSALSPGLSIFAVNASKSAPPPVEASTLEGWASKELFGSSTTTFLPTDGIYVMVRNKADIEDQPFVTINLVDPYGNKLVEKAGYVFGYHGTAGFGDFNPGRSMRPGVYYVEILRNDSLLQSIAITVTSGTPDTTPPTITIISPAKDSLLQNSSVPISASYSDDVVVDARSIVLRVDGVAVIPVKVTPSAVEYTANLGEGTHSLSLTVKDISGNTASANWSFTIKLPLKDTTPPTITIISPAKDSVLSTKSVNITASYSDDVAINAASVTLKVDGRDVTPQSKVTAAGVSYSTTLEEGPHSVFLVVNDTSGNIASANWSFTVKAQQSGCVIATATYGSELAPQVQFLRDFRDNLALKTSAGSSFMTVFNMWYYSWSPYVAAYIAPHPSIRAVMRVILQPLLNILELAVTTFSLFSFNSELGIVVAGIVASSLIGLVYFTPATVLVLAALYRSRGSVPPVRRKIMFLVVPLTASLVLILASELVSSQLLMMVATSTLVLSTIALVVGVASFEITRYLRR